jgi:subtilisin-like proprotein convertase family protein
MKKTLLFFFSIISLQTMYGQEILMQNGSTNTCGGFFYDSGGEFSNYSSNENFVYTICPDVAGGRIRLDFQEFGTQLNADTMIIYDGDSTSSSVIGEFSGSNSPMFIFASADDNPTGCLTIEFSSNGSGTTTGWSANISCAIPCQDITSQLDSTLPLPNGDGIIEVCTGDLITLNGSGIFEVDGTGATYVWDLGNGSLALGETVNISYNIPGVFLVDLQIRDTNTDNFAQGCTNSNTINQVIRVSGQPDFTGTQANANILCFGESTTIEGIVNPATLFYNCPPPESEETPLPDGSGASYSTCVEVTCFQPNDILLDISQLSDICINMEHSYSGDLDIKIISPNGQEANLFTQAGVGTYFGEADDTDNGVPGVGADYCFSMSATTLLENANTIIAGTNPPNNSWEPGSYLPVDSFESLVGSPLNGSWCIVITDNIILDDGYIFSWELNFDSNLPLEDFTFVPSITSQSWDSDPSITEVNGNIITVAPDASGEYCYTYRTVDVFGCEYSEDVCIIVADEGQSEVTYYEDNDGDGYGDPNSTESICSSVPRLGYVDNDLDCNDTDALVNPDADDQEGDGIDSNCDGVDGFLLSLDDFLLSDIKIRPNPFIDKIHIDLDSRFNNSYFTIKIYDINGRVIYENTKENINGIITINNLSGFERAPYFLNISNNEFGINTTKKLFKI